jgi:hypothetical protein
MAVIKDVKGGTLRLTNDRLEAGIKPKKVVRKRTKARK